MSAPFEVASSSGTGILQIKVIKEGTRKLTDKLAFRDHLHGHGQHMPHMRGLGLNENFLLEDSMRLL